MKLHYLPLSVLSLIAVLLLSNCKEKEDPVTDFSQFVLGQWTLAESNFINDEVIDECNFQTTYRFGSDGNLNINPVATAYDENNIPYCTAPINDGLGYDLNYSISGNRMESELGNATLMKSSETSLKLTFDNEDLGIVDLIR
ncbi:hypothetical protein SAMN04489724_0243 [Algoriphagus locisalis]|uniref:Lipocalin-like domain-containing protein n=1 Tax=Algoriphagus locisalis TaxID=305507 RepID=A0A1I7E859_9BACT|nr:hypothetical protein [Algoriphagus locisalis]SFU20120.1 hypothetical protein SAMN04489724_0243 [Algoriphagus locisalis]